jgi:uncharacterized protein YmfQ (DUF2313 family)
MVMTPHSAANYAQQLAALLPPGLALTVTPGGELDAVLLKIGEYLCEVEARALVVLNESDPRNASALLTEWELSLGLPDSCASASQNIAARREAVLNRLTDVGGARIPRYLAIAARLGYPDATITRHRMHTCESTCMEPVNDPAWRFVWTLNIPADAGLRQSTCESTCMDPLATWGDERINCVIQKQKPAISQAFIAYQEG